MINLKFKLKRKTIFFLSSYVFWILGAHFAFSSSLLTSTLTFLCPHKTISYHVEVVTIPREQARGLMFRTHLSENEGMVFLYPTPRPVAMWMKNTLISLDMIFSDREGRILALHENAVPHSLQPIGPIHGTTRVLEIKRGSIQKHGITHACTLTLNR